MLHDWGVIAAAFGYIGFLFLRGELWRPAVADPARPCQRADLSAVAGHLLHVLDVFRLGRIRHPHQRGFSRYLYRADRDDRILHAAAAPCDPAGEIAEHHLDRRFHRRALRQEPGGGGHRCADRNHRIGSLHRAPAQGHGVVARNHPQRRPGLFQNSDHRRYRADGDAGDGGIRGAVRDPPDRRHRTSAWPDTGGRHRIHRQAGGLYRRRRLRHVLDVRPGRTGRAGDEDPGSGPRHRLRAVDRQLPHHGVAVVLRDHVAAAPVSRQRGREFQRCRGRAGAVAVSAVSGRHQPVRDSDRARRSGDLPVRRCRQRHVCAGAADRGKCAPAQPRRLSRRPFGGAPPW